MANSVAFLSVFHVYLAGSFPFALSFLNTNLPYSKKKVSPNETFGDVNKKTEAMIVSVDSVGVCRWWCCINYMIYAVD